MPSEQFRLISQWPKLRYITIPGYKRVLRRWVPLCKHFAPPPKLELRPYSYKERGGWIQVGHHAVSATGTVSKGFWLYCPAPKGFWLYCPASIHQACWPYLPTSLCEALIVLRLLPRISDLKPDLDVVVPLFSSLPVDIFSLCQVSTHMLSTQWSFPISDKN